MREWDIDGLRSALYAEEATAAVVIRVILEGEVEGVPQLLIDEISGDDRPPVAGDAIDLHFAAHRKELTVIGEASRHEVKPDVCIGHVAHAQIFLLLRGRIGREPAA